MKSKKCPHGREICEDCVKEKEIAVLEFCKSDEVLCPYLGNDYHFGEKFTTCLVLRERIKAKINQKIFELETERENKKSAKVGTK